MTIRTFVIDYHDGVDRHQVFHSLVPEGAPDIAIVHEFVKLFAGVIIDSIVEFLHGYTLAALEAIQRPEEIGSHIRPLYVNPDSVAAAQAAYRERFPLQGGREHVM